MAILIFCLGIAIDFYGVLHGFRTGRGMGTTSLEAKMIQHLVAIREEVLYNILIDVHKDKNTLDRDRCLGILITYGVVTRAIHLLWWYWDRITMVESPGVYYVKSFKGYQ